MGEWIILEARKVDGLQVARFQDNANTEDVIFKKIYLVINLKRFFLFGI